MNGFMQRTAVALLGTALISLTAPAAAQAARCPPQVARTIPAERMTDGFLDGHPDLRWRSLGLKDFERGNLPRAFVRFRKAAEYADKYSQMRVAIMYREGLGVEQDPELAYAWMDLAAERGYHDFLLLREAWWSQLDQAQRQGAVERGKAVFARYADAVSKPRQEQAMRDRLGKITGSRVGFVSAGLRVEQRDGPAAGEMQTGADYYAPVYWNPEQYWCLQDTYWMAPLRQQQIDVGLPETLHDGDGR